MTTFSRVFRYGMGVMFALSVFGGGAEVRAAALEPATIPVGVEGVYYQQQMTAPAATVEPIEWSIMSGSLPPGITLGSDTTHNILIKGTPTTAGAYSFRLKAKDTNGVIYERPYTFVVERPMTISPGALSQATVGSAYTAMLNVTGGTSPYSWSI